MNITEKNMSSKGFTLIELMVVISIIGILAAIALSRFTGVTQAAKAANVQKNLTALRTSIEMFRVKNEEYPTLGESGADLNEDGSVSEEMEKYYSKGIVAIVPESLNGSGKIVQASNTVKEGYSYGSDSLFPSDGDLGGWIYRKEDGRFRANLADNAYGQKIIWIKL